MGADADVNNLWKKKRNSKKFRKYAEKVIFPKKWEGKNTDKPQGRDIGKVQDFVHITISKRLITFFGRQFSNVL